MSRSWLRAADGAAKPSNNDVFVSGLDQPFGIAFYPPGSDPHWIYVANTGSVVRYPYRSGDLKAQAQPDPTRFRTIQVCPKD